MKVENKSDIKKIDDKHRLKYKKKDKERENIEERSYLKRKECKKSK